MKNNKNSDLNIETLFDPELLARIDHLALMVRNIQMGGRLAEQRTKARGQGIEFADFKPYVAGDDLRSVDWKSYQRLGKLFVRVFEEQQAMPVYFLVDLSASMFSEVTSPRIHAALRCTMALAAIALGQHDSVAVFALGEQASQIQKNSTGRGSLIRMATQLSGVKPLFEADISAALQQFANMPLRRGLAVVVSDFFNPEGLAGITDALDSMQHAQLLVRLTQPWDANPELNPDLADGEGEVRFEDSETQQTSEVMLSPMAIKAYKAVYAEFMQEINEIAQSRQAGLLTLDCSSDIVEQLSDWFAQGAQL